MYADGHLRLTAACKPYHYLNSPKRNRVCQTNMRRMLTPEVASSNRNEIQQLSMDKVPDEVKRTPTATEKEIGNTIKP